MHSTPTALTGKQRKLHTPAAFGCRAKALKTKAPPRNTRSTSQNVAVHALGTALISQEMPHGRA